MGRHRIVEHGGGVVPFQQQRIVELDRGQRQHGDGEHGDQDLRGVELERAAEQAQHHVARRHGAAAAVRHQPQRPAGEEHEQVGGIRDGKIHQRVARIKQAGDVVDEDRDQREAAPEIDRIGLGVSSSVPAAPYLAPPALCRAAARAVKNDRLRRLTASVFADFDDFATAALATCRGLRLPPIAAIMARQPRVDWGRSCFRCRAGCVVRWAFPARF